MGGGDGNQFRTSTPYFQSDEGVLNGKQHYKPPDYRKISFTGSARGEQALEEWEQFELAVNNVMSATTVINMHSGRYEWMILHRALAPHYYVKSGQGFETPVHVQSQFGPLWRIIMYENGTLCERMNHWDPAILNITAQQLTKEDLAYSDKVFSQIHAITEDDLVYKPLCNNAQSRIYQMLLEMTQKGSPAHQLINHIDAGKGSLAWYYLKQEFSCERATEKMAQITAFQKEPRQQPGQSVQAYGLECKKFYD